ncbi:MAG TPA: hypothetical protein VF662_09190 [Allosphingosinicella sp.]
MSGTIIAASINKVAPSHERGGLIVNTSRSDSIDGAGKASLSAEQNIGDRVAPPPAVRAIQAQMLAAPSASRVVRE